MMILKKSSNWILAGLLVFSFAGRQSFAQAEPEVMEVDLGEQVSLSEDETREVVTDIAEMMA
jgi:hypothetical protein